MKAIVFLGDGFEECEALITVDILRRAGIDTLMASVMDRLTVESSRNIKVRADIMAEDVDFKDVDLIVLPGGRGGTENLGKSNIVREKCVEFADKNSGKYVAAICAAPSLLAELGLLEDKKATCHPDFECKMEGAVLTGESVIKDENIITGQGLGASFEFSFKLVELLVNKEKADNIKAAICYKETVRKSL